MSENEKRCETCRFWPPLADDFYNEFVCPIDEDTYEQKQMPWEVRVCKCPKIVFHERPVERNGAALFDGSHYHAALYTGPDFGCVHWMSADAHLPAKEKP